MTETEAAASYDRVPYRSKPRQATHPDAAATQARLMGLSPAPVSRCRVLEIGCGTGGNIHAMAWPLPHCTFLGIDPSTVQIESARRAAERYGLRNVQFEAIGVGDLPPDAGPFDYIICHGVFSWVPPSVRNQILAVCRARLAPHGVAMISYNTYPGWHARGLCRDAMRFAAEMVDGPGRKVHQAREYLKFLAESVVDKDTPYARILADEIRLLNDRDDFYVFHEQLEEHNTPFLFREFIAQSAAHGLQYLGDAARNWFTVGFSPAIQQSLQQISRDLIDLEQHVDFLRNTTFRHTLLVRDDAVVSRIGSADRLDGMLVRSAANTDPVPSRQPLHEAVQYRSVTDVRMSTASPLMNAVLWATIDAWPKALPVPELVRQVTDRFQAERPADMAESLPLIPQAIFDLYERSFLTLHTWQADFLTSPTERPVVWPVGRDFAANGSIVPTLTHQSVRPSEVTRFVLLHCDGMNDEAALTRLVEEAVAGNRLPVLGIPATDAVRNSLAMIAGAALFAG